MATAVIMPKSGQSVETCILSRWYKKPGEQVQEGELLFSYETDKASFEEKAAASGTLLAIFYEEDADVPVLATIAAIGQEGEEFASLAPGGAQAAAAEPAPAQAGPAAPVQPAAPAAAAAAVPVAAAAAPTGDASGGASPRAKAFAARANVPLSAASPTGPHGRILERDVMAVARIGAEASGVPAVQQAGLAVQPQPAPALVAQPLPGADYREEKLPNIRKVIARSMHESLSNSAQLTNQLAFDATELLGLRKQCKEIAAKDDSFPNITINDMLLFAVSRVLLRHGALNAHFMGDSMRYYHHVNLGMAVDTPRGLLVPTIFAADTKSLRELSQESKALAAAAQSGSINPDLLSGGTFTISNLGALGTEFFTPILNPPQTGILGIGCAVERVRTERGQLTAFPAIGLSLTYDHRAVDGAPAARFLQDLKQELEHFTGLLV